MEKPYNNAFLLIVVYLLAGSVHAQSEKSYIGDTSTSLSHECVADEMGVFWRDYQFGYAVVDCDGSTRVWFQRLERVEDDEAIWQIIDELVLPEDDAGQELLEMSSCQVKQDLATLGPGAPPVAAIGRWSRKADVNPGYEYEGTNVTHAWRLNREAEKIESIDPVDVACWYRVQN